MAIRPYDALGDLFVLTCDMCVKYGGNDWIASRLQGYADHLDWSTIRIQRQDGCVVEHICQECVLEAYEDWKKRSKQDYIKTDIFEEDSL